MGSTAPTLKKLMKTQAAPIIVTYQSSKRKAAQGATQKTVTGKRLHRTRPSTAQVKQFTLFPKWYPISDSDSFLTVINHCIPICSRCWTVVLGVWISTNQTFIGWPPKGAHYDWNNRCFQNSRKSFHFTLWCCQGISSKFLIFHSIFISPWLSHLIGHYLRKYSCKNRTSAVH